MSKIDIHKRTEVSNGDLVAILNVHSRLDGLLSMICAEDFSAFLRQSAKHQMSLLLTARDISSELGELHGACLAARAIRQAKQTAQEAA